MNLPLILRLLVFSLEVSSLGLYLKDLLRPVVQLKSFLMILMMIRLIQLDLLPYAQLKGVKESACWEATQDAFTSVFSGLNDCYYCRNTIVSLFSSFVPSYSLI